MKPKNEHISLPDKLRGGIMKALGMRPSETILKCKYRHIVSCLELFITVKRFIIPASDWILPLEVGIVVNFSVNDISSKGLQNHG